MRILFYAHAGLRLRGGSRSRARSHAALWPAFTLSVSDTRPSSLRPSGRCVPKDPIDPVVRTDPPTPHPPSPPTPDCLCALFTSINHLFPLPASLLPARRTLFAPCPLAPPAPLSSPEVERLKVRHRRQDFCHRRDTPRLKPILTARRAGEGRGFVRLRSHGCLRAC